MMINQGQATNPDELADHVLQNIHDREALITRLVNVHSKEPNHGRSSRIQRLLYGLHNASLTVVESITAWNISKQDEWHRKKNIEEIHALSLPAGDDDSDGTDDHQIITTQQDQHDHHQSNNIQMACPFNTYSWNGQNYLYKMVSDLDFVGDIVEAISFLGSTTPFHRNPFLLPNSIDQSCWSSISSDTVAPPAWSDVNMQRVRQAAFVILLDEHYRNINSPNGSSSSSSIDNVIRFHPPQLVARDIEVFTSLPDPPPAIAISICCAHLVLGSVDTDITNKLVYFTKNIVLKICRQPLADLLYKAQTYNPLRRRSDGNERSMIKLVHPFVMHQALNPETLTEVVSSKIVRLVTWLRGLVTRLVDNDTTMSNKNSVSNVDRIICELEADYQRGRNPNPTHGNTVKEKKVLPADDSNKENECSRNVSVQTETISPNKSALDGTSSPQHIPKSILQVGDTINETKKLIPYPIFITINLKEGSKLVSVNSNNGSNEALQLKSGDIVRIFDAHESSNWTISDPPTNIDGLITFRLTTPYDHSRIVSQEKKTRNIALNRLCYPYRKDVLDDSPTNCTTPPEIQHCGAVHEEHIRHVACDENESIHSPLHIREARVWKLIPEEEDITRTAWRRDFDDGLIPWRNNDEASYQKSVKHFRVRVRLDTVEQSCIDSPYPLHQCVHQQRVNYFESIPLSNVIDEAFHTVCRWHPKGNLIDNVKWAKLSRKMRFLSNVKNANHEIDMAFVRRNQDRKLDLARFHAIFDDIASIQYPALTREDALSKVVWASIVMLPDVNTMMWIEAKQMAVNAEVKRVCAQTRIATLVRKIRLQAVYQRAKVAAITIATHVRQFLARLFVSNLLQVMRADKEYQLRCKCAKIVQTSWRRFFWRNRFILHQERRAEEVRQKIAAIRTKLQALRQREKALIVYRDVIRLEDVIATVTISFHDDTLYQDGNSMLIKVYVPTTKETFTFNVEEDVIRECLEKALSSEGGLSWDEMLNTKVLSELTKRLMLRVVRGRPIFLFSKRNIVEKGLLIDKRIVRAVKELFILSTFRSPHDFVFHTYQPSNCVQMRIKLSIPKLREWLCDGTPSSSTAGEDDNSGCGGTSLLDPKKQNELIKWLVKRIIIRKHPKEEDNLQILLQFEAEEERVLKLVTKVQAQWRRLQSLRCAKDKTTKQYEKIFVRENNVFAYRNIVTDERQWEKPKLLGNLDLNDPVDEWRVEEMVDSTTGEKQQYYANYGTGQTSWLSEEDAARMVQRRYRSKHEADLLGKKLHLKDVVKAMKFIHGARERYELEPRKLSNIVNFALLVHCLDLDFIKAKPVYEKALELSPNHPLICRAYGIFLLASRQTPSATTFQTACRLFNEANIIDPTQVRFQSAAEIYFRWAVLVDAKNPLTLLNYALLHQCIYKKYDRAEKIYRAALALDPTNQLVGENYKFFLNERYPGGEYVSQGPPFSVLRRARIMEEQPEWAEWRKMTDIECPKSGFETFWYNRLTKETSFEQPCQKMIWQTRLRRSKCIAGKTSNWVEYFDSRLQQSFYYDVYTKQYSCKSG